MSHAPIKKKRSYEPPTLESVSAIEAGSALCCKSTPATCTNAAKSGSGKGRRTKDDS